MRMLSGTSGLSNADIARGLNVSPQATNIVVHTLVERGLVERPLSAPSGRSLPNTLSSVGDRLLEHMDRGVRQAERGLLQSLSSRQRREFKQILIALANPRQLPTDGAQFVSV
jgi:DNA-binding MarR family transcriptional regulator